MIVIQTYKDFSDNINLSNHYLKQRGDRGMNNSFESFELSTELIFQRFLMDKERRKNFYNGLELADYIALKVMEKDCIDGKDKTYLKDLSSFMRISIPQTSAIASSLKDMGYALWKHDGKGTDGTYLVFTDAGRDFLKKERTITENIMVMLLLNLVKKELHRYLVI